MGSSDQSKMENQFGKLGRQMNNWGKVSLGLNLGMILFLITTYKPAIPEWQITIFVVVTGVITGVALWTNKN